MRYLTPLLLAASALILAGASGAVVAQVAEAELKAAFVFNFAAFVVWPDEAPADALTICVRSGSGLQDALARLDGKSIDNHHVTTRVLTSVERIGECRILVADAAQLDADVAGDWPPSWWQRDGVLSVADGGDSARNGTVVTLVRDGSRVRFDIDGRAAERAHLTLSSKLLRLARKVL